MASMNEFWEQIKKVFARFTLTQKISLAALTIALLAIFIIIMNWASRPKFGVLFSSLTSKDAGRIVEELQTSKIPYKLEASGATVLIPEKQVYEQRMKFANLGIPMEGTVGYELFDQTKLGMTDFVQKLNYHRALEGELSRTLTGINEILSARVHIVIPKPALFQEDKKPATASVALKLKSDALSRSQIQGIANLVASSVEGLTPDNITIIDSRGNILSSDLSKDKALALSASQYELQRQVEEYLEKKAQTMLMGALGPDRSIIRVTAELDFDRIEKTAQTFDPASQVVRSEEVSTKTGTSNSQSQSPPPGQSSTSNSQDDQEAVITNYEISNTLEHVVQAVGNIGRLTIAVLVDGKYNLNKDAKGEEVQEYAERTPEEITKLTSLIKNAIGFNPARGDEITVTSFPFDTTQDQALAAEFADAAKYEFWRDVMQKGLMGIIVLAMLVTIRALLKRSRRLAGILMPPSPPGLKPALAREKGLSSEDEAAKVRAKVREEIGKMEMQMAVSTVEKEEIMSKINEFIRLKPAEASTLIRTWLNKEEE